ncbi:PucR family transcriptional regulator [Conexibacter arvalis]|nr:helix-turn-helix domain-containing protein [Conexibacter arvalis]
MATLERLCADLGADLIEVVEAPRGLDVAVLDASVHDPAEPLAGAVADGDLVLAVGAGIAAETTAALLRDAGAAGAAGVVCKRRGTAPPALRDAARAAGVALLTADPDLAWGQLYELVRTALAADGAIEPQLDGAGRSDLFALADATAALAGGPISIEDARSRVLAFSHGGQDIDPARAATILGRRVPDQWAAKLRREAVLEQLEHAGEPVTIAFDGLQPRRAIAIRAGSTTLGSIWLAVGPDGPSPTADEVLRSAAQIAALHLLRRRVTKDLERRLRATRLRALLTGEGGTRALEQLELAGDGIAVAAVAIDGSGGDAAALERLGDLLVMHLRAYRRQAEATVLDERLYVLAGCREGSDRDALRRCLGDGLSRAAQALRARVDAGLSRSAAGAEAVVAARRAADQALELGPRDGGVVGFEEVHAQAIVADVRAFLADRGTVPSPELEALVAHDREHGTDFVATLRVSLEARSDNRETARRLGVHINTVRYRLRRIAELTRLRLDDGDVRFAIELQLRLLPLGAGDGDGAREAPAAGGRGSGGDDGSDHAASARLS